MRTSMTKQSVGLAGLLLAGALAVAACGSTAAPSADAGTPSVAATAPATAPGGGDLSAFRSCMAENGVELPDGGGLAGTRPSGMPTGMPTGMPSGAPGGRPSGGPPAMGLPDGVTQEQFDAAMTACGSLAPAAMGAGGAGDSAMAAFTSCLSDHGVSVAEGGRPTDLDRSDPAVAAAWDVCSPLLGSGATPSPAAS